MDLTATPSDVQRTPHLEVPMKAITRRSALSVAPLPLTAEQITYMILARHALRSGEFEQAPETLRGPRGFCCLGAMCEVASQHGGPVTEWIASWTYATTEDGAYVPKDLIRYHTSPFIDDEGYEHDGKSDFLPDNVMDWFGFTDNDPVILTVSVRAPFASLAENQDCTITLPHSEYMVTSHDIPDPDVAQEFWLHFSGSALNDAGVPFSTIGSLLYTGIIEPAIELLAAA